ncbi:hypothetical protein QGM71_08670 [Virgibacillus sp. C22-A2]|uniref:Uncharacterized protein n=1 Tax=Virgibacillus tibetensis TaxID=3042313 RepID=A0ABU6KEI9_9BACI|nr:hypothetical protein [Virgibacillus sp. C22-A2]
MKLGYVFVILVIAVLITLYEWPKIDKNLRKEKQFFIVFTVGGVLLAILLIYFPTMPGPSQLVEIVFKPLGKLMEPK